MIIRVDYHFHPNLPRSNEGAIKKCQKIWKKFREKNINCVIITEHAYKNPKRAYELILKTKPEDDFCFPGIECITKEGIDIVVFSNNEMIYRFPELKPFKLSYFDLINFAQTKKLHTFVTHPYTLGLTSVINKLGFENYKKALNILNAVEISNGAFDNLYFLINKFPFKFIFKSKLKKINKTKKIPELDHPKKVKFFAVGSDAHHAEEIGNCYEISCPSNSSKEELFKMITNNSGKGIVFCDKSKKFSLVRLLITAPTPFFEFLTKTILKFKTK